MRILEEKRKIELLAPAKNANIGIQAIIHGADAVYIGASHHGARVAAGNSIDEISRLVSFAHLFNAKVYVTVNTIIYDDEIEVVKALISDLYRIGVDAVIVQDMAIIEMNIPPIALHASTQCDIRDKQKAKFLSLVGFSQLVLARELTLNEISDIHKEVDTPLEVFVHGALCVCYSGDCQAGYMAMGRSANRGECPQICRLSYDLIDGLGNEILSQKHLLSLRDMNRLDHLEQLLDAGVTSFKIEGRLKDEKYVKTVVAAYRSAIDKIIDANPEKYCRASIGITEFKFSPDVKQTFNRGFTSYFLTNRRQTGITSYNTPKSIGVPVGVVIGCNGNKLMIRQTSPINNGDGLGFFDDSGSFVGFRVNKVGGNSLFLRNCIPIPQGITIYRNKDVKNDAFMSRETAHRYIPVDITLRHVSDNIIAADIEMEQMRASTTIEFVPSTAKTSQYETRKKIFSKLGDTVYMLRNFVDRLGDIFVSASILTALRRSLVETLNASRAISYNYSYRKSEDIVGNYFKCNMTRHDNVSNILAEDFYRRHGATSFEHAVEVRRPKEEEEIQVMATRYCLRREIGACLRTPMATKLIPPLHLKHGNLTYRLDFDCKNCQMKVIQTNKKSDDVIPYEKRR